MCPNDTPSYLVEDNNLYTLAKMLMTVCISVDQPATHKLVPK